MAENQNSITKTRDRSTPYPAVTLQEAVESIIKLRNNLGRGYADREVVAKALGYKGISGASAGLIAALGHYGLLERQGNSYRPSELSERITHEVSSSDRASALRETAATPKLWRMLLERYDGGALPDLLPNLLIRDGVSANASSDVAKLFRTTIEYAGILNNGLVSFSEVSKAGTDLDRAFSDEVPRSEDSQTFKSDNNRLELSLRPGAKFVVQVPYDITEREAAILKRVIDSLVMSD